MPSEACYLVSIENAIILCLVYGILSSYFDDVMSSGFLFFTVFIGMSLSYVSIVFGFALLLFDDTTSRQIVLLDADGGAAQSAPGRTRSSVAQLARVLARTGAVCVVAMFILFVTVGVEFFTEDHASESDSLPTVALKKAPTETFLTTQFAVSTAIAVFFIIQVMVLSNSQQLTAILVRLDHMTQSTRDEQTSTSDDLALFVRTLLILYVIVCDSVGTFKHLPAGSVSAALVDAAPVLKSTWSISIFGSRNNTSLLVLAWFWLIGVAETFLPVFLPQIIVFVAIKLLYLYQIILSLAAIEILLGHVTLTNMACVVVVACDACLIFYISVYRIYHELRARKWLTGQPTATNEDGSATQNEHEARITPNMKCRTVVLCEKDVSSHFDVNEQHINVESLNWSIFQKKSN